MEKEERIKFVELGLRILQIQLSKELLEKVIKVIDKVDELKGQTTLKDICEL